MTTLSASHTPPTPAAPTPAALARDLAEGVYRNVTAAGAEALVAMCGDE